MRGLTRWVLAALILAWGVAGLGAYTRLTAAGLGCPDWPGCYGQLRVPSGAVATRLAEARYPAQPIETRKAWTEMTHRYVAGGLGCMVLVSLGWSLWLRRQQRSVPLGLPIFLCGWIVFQALLGRYTVTWRLLPAVVTAHLLAGTLLVAGLAIFYCQLQRCCTVTAASPAHHTTGASPYQRWLLLGMILIGLQMALGGWVSSNDAGIACVGFPTCNGEWFPSLTWQQLGQLFSPEGVTHQPLWLQRMSRAAIQLLHRWGAVMLTGYLLGLMCYVKRVPFVVGLLMLLLVQWALGVINVLYFLPLSVAVMHNMVAMALLIWVTIGWCKCDEWSTK